MQAPTPLVRNFALRGSTKSMSVPTKAAVNATNQLKVDGDFASKYANYGMKVACLPVGHSIRSRSQFQVVASVRIF